MREPQIEDGQLRYGSHAFCINHCRQRGESIGIFIEMAKEDAKEIQISQEIKLEMIDFLAFYKNITHVHTDTDLERRYPQVKNKILSIFKRNQLITKSNSEIKTYDFSTLRNNMIVYTKKDTKTLCLLRHFRNSIAHWNIKLFRRDIKYFEIQDFNSSEERTAYGILTKETIIELLKIHK